MPARRSEAVWNEKLNCWHIKVQKDGQRRSFYSSLKGRAGKHEAEGKADEWLESNTAKDVTLGQAWNQFLATKKPPLRKQETYLRFQSNGKVWILPTIGENKKLSRITPENWQQVLDQMAMSGWANNKNRGKCAQRTISSVRSVILTFCEWARDIKRWPICFPSSLTIASSAPRPKKVRILQPDDLRVLFSSDQELWFGKPRSSPFINAFRFTVLVGARRGEICGMKWEDIHGSDWYISRAINRLQEETTTKSVESERIVALHPRAMKILCAQRAVSNGSPWVFPDPCTGEHMNPNAFYKAWKRYCQANGLSCDLHELRHTFISYAKADVPEVLLKAIVGHTDDMDTYGVYGHDVAGDRERTANILDSVFSRILNETG